MKRLVYVFVGIIGVTTAASAQESFHHETYLPVVRSTEWGSNIPCEPDHEVHMLTVDFRAGAFTGLRRHAGEHHATVVQGDVMVRIGAANYRSVKAGQTYSIPAYTAVDVRNTSSEPAKVIAVLILERGKPMFEYVAD